MPYTFRGGIYPDDKKKYTNQKPIEALPSGADVLIYPLSQHIGAPAVPLVQAGDRVLVGQKIADSAGPVSAPIHAGVSGTVLSVGPAQDHAGPETPCIRIENDKENTLLAGIGQKANLELVTNEQIIEKIHESGIVGLGGAAFPTHVKVKSGRAAVDTVIINGAECEPYITADHALMLADADKLIAGLLLLVRLFEVKYGVIAVEANKSDVIKRLSHRISRFPQIKLRVLPTKYPQGAEKQLIKVVTGREVPPGGLPAAVGCIVFNAATTVAMYEAVIDNKPLYERVITISGKTVANPKNYRVPIGTPVQHLIDCCGGLKEPPYKIILGGPMTGTTVYSTAVPVTKGTNCLLVYSRPEETFVENPVCIRCARCADVCPMRLMPLYLYQFAQAGQYDKLKEYHLTDCIECGCCSYVCPGKIPLVHTFKTAKAKKVNKKG